MYGNKELRTRIGDSTNKFRFPCPIFQNNVLVRDCVKINFHHMRGERVPNRNGCHACITAQKCPAFKMEREEWRAGKELYYSATDRTAKYSDNVHDNVKSVIVTENTIARYDLSPAEAALIRKANEDVIPADQNKARSRRASVVAECIPEDVVDANIVEAAISGDMAAAVNEGTK